MKIKSDINGLKLRVSGIKMNFAFDYKIWSEPGDWIKDEGVGDVNLHNTDIDLELSLTSKNGAL